MNNVQLMGRLTKKPELKYTEKTAVCTFVIAVDRPTKKEKEKHADFIRIITFGKTAENCSKYTDKGLRVLVDGRIQTGRYETNEGETVYTFDVIAGTVNFIDWKGNKDDEEKDGNEV